MREIAVASGIAEQKEHRIHSGDVASNHYTQALEMQGLEIRPCAARTGTTRGLSHLPYLGSRAQPRYALAVPSPVATLPSFFLARVCNCCSTYAAGPHLPPDTELINRSLEYCPSRTGALGGEAHSLPLACGNGPPTLHARMALVCGDMSQDMGVVFLLVVPASVQGVILFHSTLVFSVPSSPVRVLHLPCQPCSLFSIVLILCSRPALRMFTAWYVCFV